MISLAGCNSALRPTIDATAALTPSTSPVTTVATPIVLENGWYQYRDPDYGYSFSYPPETRVKIGKSHFGNHSAQLQFRLPGVTGYQGIVIRVWANPQDSSLEEMLAKLYEQSAQELAPAELLQQVELTTVAGLPAIKTSILPTNTEFSLLFLYQDKVYLLAPVHGPTASQVNPQALDLFYQVVNTLAVK